MTPYILLAWPPDDQVAVKVAQQIRAMLRMSEAPWRLLLDRPGQLCAIRRDALARVHEATGHATLIIGDLFPLDQRESGGLLTDATSFDRLCARLTSDFWGAYLSAQFHDGGVSLFRDPIGMRDCISWTHSGVRFVASDPLPWLAVSAPRELAIDWARIAQLLSDPSTCAEAPPLAGIETIPAGTIVQLNGERRTTRRLWQPSQFYDRARSGRADPAKLRSLVSNCVQAWRDTYPNNVLELSGGFDSAVVAAAATDDAGSTSHGINFFTDDSVGDERRYARDISAHCRLSLDEVLMAVGRLSEADLRGMPVGVRPGLGSVTLFHDRALARIATARGAKALFTGHGGDALFFQHPTATIAADPSFPRTSLKAWMDLAGWSRSSLWTIARHAWRLPFAPSGEGHSLEIAPFPVASVRHTPPNYWAGDLADLPPAKQMQINAIAGERSAFGPSWRSEALTVVHPLLSQPLVEYAIATDTYILTNGQRDRALAREAFAGALPPSVLRRKGKGSLTHFFGRSLAASTPFLRSYLLDGLLAHHGVLDRSRLEPMLDRDYLMRFDCYAALLSAIVTEHWARIWHDRLASIRQTKAAPKSLNITGGTKPTA